MPTPGVPPFFGCTPGVVTRSWPYLAGSIIHVLTWEVQEQPPYNRVDLGVGPGAGAGLYRRELMTHNKPQRHVWILMDDGIAACKHCGMYRCTAAVKRDRPTGDQWLKTVVEYSDPEGGVIAVDPAVVPDCVREDDDG